MSRKGVHRAASTDPIGVELRFDGLVISNRIVRDAEFLREVGSSPKIVALCAKKVRVGTWRAIAPMDGWK